MVKFTASDDDGPLIGLGLSKDNIRLLRQGKPIVVDLEKDLHLPPGRILLFYGDTEASITKALLPYISEDTIVQGTETLRPT